MAEPVYDELKATCLQLLEKSGLTVTEHRDYPDTFGNSFAVLENGHVRIRFARDRGDLLVDVAESAAPEEWQPLLPDPPGPFDTLEAACASVLRYLGETV